MITFGESIVESSSPSSSRRYADKQIKYADASPLIPLPEKKKKKQDRDRAYAQGENLSQCRIKQIDLVNQSLNRHSPVPSHAMQTNRENMQAQFPLRKKKKKKKRRRQRAYVHCKDLSN